MEPIRIGYTTYDLEISRSEARKCARGKYQKRLLSGDESWNGSTLRGKALEWAGRYCSSREALLARLREASLIVLVRDRAATITLTHERKVQWILADETHAMAERVELVLQITHRRRSA